MKNNFVSAIDKMRPLQIMYNIAMAKIENLMQLEYDQLDESRKIKYNADNVNNAIKKIIEQENKYYTPSVQDIHIGGEYELLHNGVWEPLKIIRQYDLEYDWEDLIFSKQLRVKYLTPEHIESEGWQQIESCTGALAKMHGNFTTMPFIKRIFALWYDESQHYLRIGVFAGVYPLQVLFNGICPSINDLRYIQRLLNI